MVTIETWVPTIISVAALAMICIKDIGEIF